MSSPLHVFRRHQRALLAIFGVIIIFIFTVGSIISQYQTSQMPGGQSKATVVTWKHGKITEEGLYQMRTSHAYAVRFLDELVRRTLKAGGEPKSPGVTRDGQGNIMDPGIPRSLAEADLVRTAVLAAKAEEMGLIVNDDAVLEFLDALSDDQIPRSEYGTILQEVSGGRMIRPQLFDQLRRELAAQYVRMVASGGLLAMTPGDAWDYFTRVNRRINAEVLPVKVADFVEQVKETPSDADIQALYDASKDRFPHPLSPEIGFKRRKQIAFEYLKADFTKFLDQHMAAVTAEEVEKYYQEHLEDFQVPELPPVEDAGATKPVDEPAKPSEEKPTEEKPSEEKPADKPADEKPEDKSQDAKPAETKPAEEKPAEEKPAEEKPAEEKPAEEKSTEEKPGGCQTEQPPAPAEEPAKPAEEPAKPAVEAKPAETKPAESKPAEEPAPPAVEPTKPEEKPAENPSEKPQEKPADEPGKTASETKPAAQPAPAEKKYKPLAEVEQEIRRTLARPKAQEQQDAALKKARSIVDGYHRQRVKWEAMVKTKSEAKEPEPLNPERIAADLGLIAGDIPLVDYLQVRDYELGKTMRFSFFNRQVQTIDFATIAFQEDRPKYQTDEIRSFETDSTFLFWKIDEKPDYVPELKDIRDEVIAAWKRQKAIKLAEAEAEKLAKAAGEAKSLKDTVGAERAKDVVDTGEFSWMTRGGTPMMGFGAPSLSPVEGVEAAGEDFMKAVFQLPVGGVGTAVNQPKTIVYVVRVASETPAPDKLREQFLQTGISFESFHMAASEREGTLNEWYDELDGEMRVKWSRDPDTRRGNNDEETL